MNKYQFMAQLHDHLSALPPEERNELMEDYEAHFTFALQNGKTEEEIALELGDPAELAREAIGNRFIPKEPVYWFNPVSGASPGEEFRPQPPAKRRGGFATAMVYTGLFFLNLIAVPLLLSVWSVGVGLAVSALAGILSPILLGMEYFFGNGFFPAKGFAVISLVGIGILLTLASRYVFKGLVQLSKGYWGWNVRATKGGVK